MIQSTCIRWLRWRAVFMALWMLLCSAMAEDVIPEPEVQPPSVAIRGEVGTGIPNASLPEAIIAPENKVTFYADFAAYSNNQIPLYLINRSAKPIEFSSQDGDIYVKLERQNQDGSWERAQAHSPSFCGNSYVSVRLSPGQHFKWMGYMPSSGVKSKVRFASFRNSGVVSNEGEGFYLPSDVEDAWRDPIGRFLSWSLEDRLQTANGDREAIPHSPESRVIALRLIQAAGVNPYYQKKAAEWAAIWEQKKNPTAEEKNAAQTMRKILAEPWSDKRDFEALLARCFEALTQGKLDEFGMPEKDPMLVWAVIAELAQGAQIENSKIWKQIRDYVNREETRRDLVGIMAIASVPRLSDELFPSAFFEKHFFNSNPEIQRTCAQVLSRRQEWDRLTQLGWKAAPSTQLIVLGALALPDESWRHPRNPPYSTDEHLFWMHCLKTQPLKAASTLRYFSFESNLPLDRKFREPLRDYLAAEAIRGAKADEDFEMGAEGDELRAAVKLLDSWQMKEDDPIFQQLLKYRGYQKSEVLTSAGELYLQRRFGIREAAKEILLRRGQPLSEAVVTEEKTSL